MNDKQDTRNGLEYASVTTLNRIRKASPCKDGWRKLLAGIGKSEADDEPLDLVTVLDSNGIDDAIWVLSYAIPDDRIARHFQAWCAEQVLHIFEADRPDDMRVRDQIAMLRRDDATHQERAATRDAARDAARAAAWGAARAAAWGAARAAAWDAARDAARAAAWGAAWGATRDAARDAAWGAAWGATRDAAWGAASDAARDAASDAQEKQLRLMMAMRKGELS